LTEYLESLSSLEAIPAPLFQRLGQLFREFQVTGGMPEVVQAWVERHDSGEADRIQDAIITSYYLDYSKHTSASDIPKLKLIWDSLPGQLARENGKFLYGMVRSGARARDLESALRWLNAAGMVHAVHRVEMPGIHLSSHQSPDHFKLYMPDVGLLRRQARVPPEILFQEAPLYREFKGALIENLVLQELLGHGHEVTAYWSSGNTAEVDFLMMDRGRILPIEVKSGQNVRSKSLQVYRDRYQPPLALRFSLQNLHQDEGLLNIPLFLVGKLGTLLEKMDKRP